MGANRQGGAAPAAGGSDTNPTGHTATNDLGNPFPGGGNLYLTGSVTGVGRLDHTNAPAFANAGLQVVRVGNTLRVAPEPSVHAPPAVAFGTALLPRRRRQGAA